MSTTNKEWEGIHPDLVSTDQAKHILSESQKYLAAINELSDRITKRSFTILAIVLSFCSIIYSVLWNSLVKGVMIDLTTYWPVVITIFPIIFPLIKLLKVIFPRDSFPIGRRPKQVNMEIFEKTQEENKEKYFYLSEIRVYQKHIDFVENQNINRTNDYKNALQFLIGYAFFLLLFLIIYCTSIGVPSVPGVGVVGS
jgi:ABC-type multidrug transport system fused ATPase/permease subunit